MNQITQFIPPFMAPAIETEVVDFDGLDELLAIQFVANFKSSMPDFHRFSLSKYGDAFLLMAEYQEGYVWWVVGAVRERVAGLPHFRAKLREQNGYESLKPGNRS